MSAVTVTHNPPLQRFECQSGGYLCVADYTLCGDVMQMTHTEVHPSLQGQGIAAALVRAAIDHARANHWKIAPACAYVRVYMQRHPDTHDLLAQ